MAHPKFSSLVGRSALTVSTAAILVGPFAGMASAQVDVTTTVEQILVNGELVDAIIVDGEWVDPLTLEPIEGAPEVVEGTTNKVKKTVNDTKPVAQPSEGAQPGGTDPIPVLGGGDTTPDPTGPVSGPPKSGAGNTPTPIDEGSSGTSDGGTTTQRQRRQPVSNTPAPATHYMSGSGNVDFNPGASPWGGFSTMSSLTLQPFDEPIAAPGAYGLSNAAADLFLPQAASTATTPTSSGASSTSAPPTWLLATSTGLLMLVGAGHFVRLTTRNLNPAE